MRKLTRGRPLFEAQVIPHKKQAYDTAGDWRFTSDDALHLRVSDMKNDDYAFLVLVHEMIEAWLCRKRGVDQNTVTAFDEAFEAARPEGNLDEPGDDPNAPYKREHFFATAVERLLAAELGVDWAEYEKAVYEL